jgi:hypothetical protein
MPKSTPAVLPHHLSKRSKFERHIGTVIEAQSEDDFDQLALELTSLGFIQAQSRNNATVAFVKPKRMGPTEIFAVVFGLFCFIIPGVLWLMIWSRRPPQVVFLHRSLERSSGVRPAEHRTPPVKPTKVLEPGGSEVTTEALPHSPRRDVPAIRVCEECGGEFTPLMMKDACPDCGGELLSG